MGGHFSASFVVHVILALLWQHVWSMLTANLKCKICKNGKSVRYKPGEMKLCVVYTLLSVMKDPAQHSPVDGALVGACGADAVT